MGRVTPQSVIISVHCLTKIQSAQAGHREGTKLSTGLPTTSSCVELSLENLQSIFEPTLHAEWYTKLASFPGSPLAWE